MDATAPRGRQGQMFNVVYCVSGILFRTKPRDLHDEDERDPRQHNEIGRFDLSLSLLIL